MMRPGGETRVLIKIPNSRSIKLGEHIKAALSLISSLLHMRLITGAVDCARICIGSGGLGPHGQSGGFPSL